MKIAFFDTHKYDREAFLKANLDYSHEISYFEPRLTLQSAAMASGHRAVCAFVNDCLNAEVLKVLKNGGTEIVALRSAGFNHVDLKMAKALDLKIVRVPEYSPFAVAEHALALIQTLNRKTHRAFNRVREGTFSIEGLVGFDLHGKTIGIIGTGKIGKTLGRIMRGFGMEILLFDVFKDQNYSNEIDAQYVSLDELLQRSDIISLHIPLTPESHHLINSSTLARMKKGVMLINTGRGGLVDSNALVGALKSGQVGAAGLDVYEEEEGLFFQDHSGEILGDDQMIRLMTFPNVLITGHQAFLTHEALGNIAHTTLQSVTEFEKGTDLTFRVQ